MGGFLLISHSSALFIGARSFRFFTLRGLFGKPLGLPQLTLHPFLFLLNYSLINDRALPNVLLLVLCKSFAFLRDPPLSFDKQGSAQQRGFVFLISLPFLKSSPQAVPPQ